MFLIVCITLTLIGIFFLFLAARLIKRKKYIAIAAIAAGIVFFLIGILMVYQIVTGQIPTPLH